MYIAMYTFKISFVTVSTGTITATDLQTEEDLLILKPILQWNEEKNWHKEKPVEDAQLFGTPRMTISFHTAWKKPISN